MNKENAPRKHTGIFRLVMACKYSYDGVKNALKNEAAFRQEAMLAIVLIPTAIFLGVGLIEKLLLVGSVILLMIVELLNSAIEECVNLCTSQIHPLAKRSKDMASAAVSFAIINLIIVWVVILWNYFCA